MSRNACVSCANHEPLLSDLGAVCVVCGVGVRLLVEIPGRRGPLKMCTYSSLTFLSARDAGEPGRARWIGSAVLCRFTRMHRPRVRSTLLHTKCVLPGILLPSTEPHVVASENVQKCPPRPEWQGGVSPLIALMIQCLDFSTYGVRSNCHVKAIARSRKSSSSVCAVMAHLCPLTDLCLATDHCIAHPCETPIMLTDDCFATVVAASTANGETAKLSVAKHVFCSQRSCGAALA